MAIMRAITTAGTQIAVASKDGTQQQAMSRPQRRTAVSLQGRQQATQWSRSSSLPSA